MKYIDLTYLAQHVIAMWKYRGICFGRGSIPHSQCLFLWKNINTIKSYQQEKADCRVTAGLQLPVCFILHVCKIWEVIIRGTM